LVADGGLFFQQHEDSTVMAFVQSWQPLATVSPAYLKHWD
jgi:hypothetical protein